MKAEKYAPEIISAKGAPEGAEVSYIARNSDLEPYYKKGDTVYLRRRLPDDGEVGLFAVDGRMVARQYVQDSEGTVYLFCLKRRRGRDIVVPKDKRRPGCFGTVITPEIPPLPRELLD